MKVSVTLLTLVQNHLTLRILLIITQHVLWFVARCGIFWLRHFVLCAFKVYLVTLHITFKDILFMFRMYPFLTYTNFAKLFNNARNKFFLYYTHMYISKDWFLKNRTKLSIIFTTYCVCYGFLWISLYVSSSTLVLACYCSE